MLAGWRPSSYLERSEGGSELVGGGGGGSGRTREEEVSGKREHQQESKEEAREASGGGSLCVRSSREKTKKIKEKRALAETLEDLAWARFHRSSVVRECSCLNRQALGSEKNTAVAGSGGE